MIPGMGREDGSVYSVLQAIEWDCPHNAIDQAARVIAGAFRAASAQQLGAALYRLRTLTRSREAQTPDDQTAETTVWLEEMKAWPGDIVLDVVRAWPRRAGKGQFWPTWAELLVEIRAACEVRIALLNHVRRLSATKAAAPPEPEAKPDDKPETNPEPTPETEEDREALVARLWTNGLRHQLQTPEGAPPQTPEQIKAAAEARLAELQAQPSLSAAPPTLSEPLLRKLEEWRAVKAET